MAYRLLFVPLPQIPQMLGEGRWGIHLHYLCSETVSVSSMGQGSHCHQEMCPWAQLRASTSLRALPAVRDLSSAMNSPLYRWQNRGLECSRDLPLMGHKPQEDAHVCANAGHPVRQRGRVYTTQVHTTARMGRLVGVCFLHILSAPQKIHHFLFL